MHVNHPRQVCNAEGSDASRKRTRYSDSPGTLVADLLVYNLDFKAFGFWVIDLVLEIGFHMNIVHVLNMIATKHGTTTFTHYSLVAKRLSNILRCSRLDILTLQWTEAK